MRFRHDSSTPTTVARDDGLRPWRRRSAVTLLLVAATACSGSAPGAGPRPTTSPTGTPSPKAARTAAAPAVRWTWPLTGLRASTRPVLPALSIKIDNVPQARPQAGLDEADLVFECLVEGGLSRLLAVYQSHASSWVGPIRSARPVDGALLRALHGGIFAYSGAAAGEIAPIKAYSTALLLSHDADPGPFMRRRDRRAPENVYASTDELRAAAARHSSTLPAPSPLFTYGPVAAGAAPASSLKVVIGSSARASWTRSRSGYVRTENGTPHVGEDGTRLRATNVVVLRVRVTGSGVTDAAGNEDPFVLAYGSGAAMVLRDGVVERGSWSRPTVKDRYRFVQAGGRPLTLAPGPTWVELVPSSGSATVG